MQTARMRRAPCTTLVARAAVLTLALLSLPATLSLTADNGPPAYNWYEPEDLITREGWGTANFWHPSGGLFAFPTPGAPPTSLTIAPGREADWAVWLRARDETRDMRRATVAVNGRASYVLGGTDAAQWVWYHVGVVHAEEIELLLMPMPGSPNMAPWFDALLLTDDLSFVPPGQPPAEEGYTAYRRSKDAEMARRPAWIWWPAHPEPGAFAYYRKAFRLTSAPAMVKLSVGAVGEYVLFVNGRDLGVGSEVGQISEHDLTGLLRKGDNVIAFEMEHQGFLPGLSVHITAMLQTGRTAHIVTDLTWRASNTAVEGWLEPDFDDDAWLRPWARIGERETVGY